MRCILFSGKCVNSPYHFGLADERYCCWRRRMRVGYERLHIVASALATSLWVYCVPATALAVSTAAPAAVAGDARIDSGTDHARSGLVEETPGESASPPLRPLKSGSNLLANGDFENWGLFGPSGPLDSWTDAYLPPGASMSREIGLVWSGVSSCRISWRTLDYPHVYSFPVEVAGSTPYVFRGYVWDEDPAGYVDITVEYFDVGGDLLDSETTSTMGVDLREWRLVEIASVSPS